MKLEYDGAVVQVREPLKAPYELIHRAQKAGTIKIRFEAPLRPTRLCLPADYTTNKLWGWNQKPTESIADVGNPWQDRTWTYLSDSIGRARLCATSINSGTSVCFHYCDYGDSPSSFMYMFPLNKTVATRFNYQINKTLNKYSYEFILDNDLEETSPTVLYDNDETLWAAVGEGSAVAEETTIKTKGTSSLKITVLSGVANSGAQETLAADTDISTKDFLCLYLYGANSGDTIFVSVTNSAGDVGRSCLVTENFTGWKRFVVPLNTMTNIGAGTLTAIRKVNVLYTNPSADRTLYVDHVLGGVGQWVRVGAYVPDALAAAGAKWNLYAWNQGTGAYRAAPFLSDTAYDETNLQFLNQTLQSQILAAGKGGAAYAQGERDQTKTPTGDSDAGNITYSAFYGCLKRIGFAVKMPPDDGADSATAGISQVRLKLEVFYADSGDPAGVEGQTTYEFQPNNTHQYYGLDNLNANWLTLYDATNKKVFYITYDQKLTGLKVCAGENEFIHWLEMSLAPGTRVYMGKLNWDNITVDADGDGVPNFLDGSAPIDEEPGDARVVYEDTDPGFTAYKSGSGNCDIALSEEVVVVASGTKSIKGAVTVPGAASRLVGAQLDYGAGATKNWSDRHYIWAWLYGNNTGLSYKVEIHSTLGTALYTQTITDNWTGWRLQKFPIFTMTATGTPNLAAIRYVFVYIDTGAAYGGAAFDWYFDRITILPSRANGVPYIVRGVPKLWT